MQPLGFDHQPVGRSVGGPLPLPTIRWRVEFFPNGRNRKVVALLALLTAASVLPIR
jgi:hypothetical protein